MSVTLRLLLLIILLLYITTALGYEITGDVSLFDTIFATHTPKVLLSSTEHDLQWTEGPLLVHNDDQLLFSDVLTSRIYSYNTKKGNLTVLMEHSGQNAPADDAWRSEPGSNGLATLSHPTQGGKTTMEDQHIVVCQHGSRRVSLLNLQTLETTPLATRWNRRRLNGPNDVIVRVEQSTDTTFDGSNRTTNRTFAYFTDPVYAWIHKDKPGDFPYVDERVREDGPGHCGVYRFELLISDDGTGTETVEAGEMEIVTTMMDRPNGIGFDGKGRLIVSDCCQGHHKDKCVQGVNRWILYEDRMVFGRDKKWVAVRTIEDVVEKSVGGCADGLAMYEYPPIGDKLEENGVRREIMIASCSDGLCIVDLKEGKVVTRMWTVKEEGGCRISNVAIGTEGVYLTGGCGLWVLPLRKGQKEKDGDNSRAEL